MKINKLIWLSPVLLMPQKNIRAQGSTLPVVIQPSPEAASLAKFVEIPVSYFNGLPDISIIKNRCSPKWRELTFEILNCAY